MNLALYLAFVGATVVLVAIPGRRPMRTQMA